LTPLPCGLSIHRNSGVFTAYSALLTPIIHILPSPRQPICRLSRQHLLLGESSPGSSPVDTCSEHVRSGVQIRVAMPLQSWACFRRWLKSENEPGLFRSSSPFGAELRTPLFAGFLESVTESVPETLGSYPCLLAVADNPRWLLHPNDDSIVGSTHAYPYSALLGGISGRIPSDPHLLLAPAD